MEKSEAFNFIKRRSLFNIIPKELGLEILKNCELLTVQSGKVLNQHLPVDVLFILVKGQVDYYVNNQFEDTIFQGRSLELDTLFSNSLKWRNTWIVKNESTFLKIRFQTFVDILSKNSLLLDYLNRISTCPEVYKIKRDLKLLNIQESYFQKIVVEMSFFDVQKNSFIDFKGKIDHRMLIIPKTGSIRVLLDLGEDKKIVDEFFTSDYFFLEKIEKLDFIHTPDFSFWYVSLKDINLHQVQDLFFIDFLQDKIQRLEREHEIDQNSEEDFDDSVTDDDQFEVSDFKPGEKELTKNHGKKFIWIQQHDMMDCGAACLAMISRFYGKKINLATWRSLVHITREGASMLSLKKAAERVGFDSIGVMSGYKALRELQVPMIALLQYHFVVVYKVDEDSVVVADPGSQLKTMTKDDFLKEFSNNALLLRPNELLKKFPDSKNTFLKYLELFRGEKLRIAEIFIISIVIFFLGLALPLFTQFVFDNVLVTMDEKFLRFVAIIFIALGFLSSTTEWIRSVLMAKLTSRLDGKFTSLFLNHVMRLPFSYFAVRNVGDITTRLGEIGKIREFFSSKIVTTFLNIFGFTIYTSILLFYKKELVLVLVPFILIFLVLLYKIITKVRTNLHDTFRAAGKNQSVIFEQMKSLETIKALGAEIAARLRFEESLAILLKLNRKFEHLLNFLQSFSGFYQEIVSLSLFLVSIYFYFQSEMTLGQVMAVQALAASITTPLIQLMQDWDELNKIGVSMEKVDEIITSRTENINLEEVKSSTSIRGDIHFENVFFQYGNEHSPMVLKKINLSIPQGRVVAFVGSSGSGKTTLAYMLNRLYSPTKGKILIGDLDTEELPLYELRSNIAMISQDNTLFAGTFLSNITLGDSNPDFQKASECAKLAHAHDFIMQKPGGYYYQLGEGGIGISGGQKQRINIARALYRDPNILIMDEATSALDAKTEKIIVENLKLRSKHKTTIIIAHRLNTIMHADTIFVFDKGHLVESGGHKELLNFEGKYYRMFKKQLELG